MAFKLLVEVTDEGVLNVNHEGQIEPIVLLGALRTLEHNVLMTVDALNAQAILEAEGDLEKPEGSDTPEE